MWFTLLRAGSLAGGSWRTGASAVPSVPVVTPAPDQPPVIVVEKGFLVVFGRYHAHDQPRSPDPPPKRAGRYPAGYECRCRGAGSVSRNQEKPGILPDACPAGRHAARTGCFGTLTSGTGCSTGAGITT